jgi:hypothetical protein
LAEPKVRSHYKKNAGAKKQPVVMRHRQSVYHITEIVHRWENGEDQQREFAIHREEASGIY